MLTANISHQKYRFYPNKKIRLNIYECDLVRGIFDQQPWTLLTEKLHVKIVTKNWKNYLPISKITGNNILDFGEVPPLIA